MRSLFLSLFVMFTVLPVFAVETRVLGNVVAEERTFALDWKDCLSNFKIVSYASYCVFEDSSIKFPETAMAIGDMPYVADKIVTGGRDTSINVTIAARKNGWHATFSLDGEVTSRAISAEQAKGLFEKLAAKTNDQFKVLVYTAK